MNLNEGIFIDTSITSELRKYHQMGWVRGITTNPTIMAKDGLKGGYEEVKNRIKEISNLVMPYPVSVELLTNEVNKMFDQAMDLASINQNIVIKVTIHGPKGELDNLKLIKELEENEISVNATAIMNCQQSLIAAMSGASYVSIFCGRVNNMGYDSREEIKKTKILLDKFKLKSKIIACSLREVINVTDWFIAGADIVTIPPKFFEGLIIHPYSKETIKMFLSDSDKLMNK